MPNIKQSASWAINKCNEDNVGYSMTYRNQRTVNGITYYDCSSFINYALNAGGFSTPSYAPDKWPFTTANMRSELIRLGFKKLSPSVAWKRGDILWRSGSKTGHTEMAYSTTQAMGARSSSYPLAEQVAIHDSSASDWMELYRYESSEVSDWYCKETGNYEKTSDEALNNCELIYGILDGYGWTLNAVCGVLGNIGAESGYNPWRWQSDNVQLSTGSPWVGKGYGLVQFTASASDTSHKYIDNPNAQVMSGYGPNFSDKVGSKNDGNAQLQFLNQYADYIKTSTYDLTYAEYKRSTQTPEYLAKAWMHNYERPASYSTESARASLARYWYTKLNGVTPPTPPTPTGYTVTVLLQGGNGWVTPYASPSSGLEEGDRVQLDYTESDPHNGLESPEFKRWRVDSGHIEITPSDYFDMPASDVVITAIFSGKTIDPPTPKKYNTFKNWYLKPWYIQNRGE